MKINRYTTNAVIAALLTGSLSLIPVSGQQDEEGAKPIEENVAEEVVGGEAEVDEESETVEDTETVEDKDLSNPVGALFDQLGAETARDRINAEKELIKQLGNDSKRKRIVDTALELYTQTDDPEIWHRVREILKSYVSEYSDFGPRRGFLGVMPTLVEYPDEKGNIRRAVRIEMVVPDTPAAKAKLRANDLILKIDDLDLDTRYADLSFFRYTFLQKGGKKVKLVILRDWEVIEVDAVLMSRPIETAPHRRREKKSPDELLRGWLEENEIELR